MKTRTLLTAAALLTPLAATASPLADARSQGMAGASIAAGDFTQTAVNPALLTRFEDNDDFYLQLGVGALAQDYQDVTDDIDEVQDTIDAFDVALDNLDQAEASRLALLLVDQLEALDQQQPQGRLGLVLGGYAPSKTFGFGVSLNAYGAVSGIVNFAESDRQLIEDAVDQLNQPIPNVDFDEDDLQTNSDLQAAVVTEIAFAMAREFNLPLLPSLSVGIAPKVQRIDSYYYNANVANFDEDDVTDDANMTDSTEFNLDIGLQSSYGPFAFALVGRNLIEQDLKNIQGDNVTLSPTITAGAAFQSLGFTAELDLDLIEDKSFDLFAEPSQWARLGLEYNLFDTAQARMGYRTDMASNYNDIFAVGLGLSPGDLVTFDVAAQFGSDDEVGGQLQLGVKF
ncbi:conjugal transfer protein TraF [uncultured Ferrimonas sp.]|uniref:conjugal transfer protein TraF n=1 Tax=uncultured Ferrimonas sp. TaxID=432640 RepID=UPI00262F09E7|nr:conjugal transfer protein TraF [uncultured Ferrimonas sp.]